MGLLDDVKVILHAALFSDLFGAKKLEDCLERFKKKTEEAFKGTSINPSSPNMFPRYVKPEATTNFVAHALGSPCRHAVSDWTWSLLRWVELGEEELHTQLNGDREVVLVEALRHITG